MTCHDVSGDRARAANETAFESIWAGSNTLGNRLQYNLEAARKEFLDLLTRARIPRSRQAVLDIGFGNGMLMFLFDRSCRLAGTEFSKSAIRLAQARARESGHQDFTFLNPTDPERLPFGDDTFDVVIASHVIEHVAADRALLRECLRVVKAQGWLLLLAPLDSSAFGVLAEEDLINPAFASGHFHVRKYNAESLVARVQACGGRIEHQIISMQTWDWKVGLDPWRGRLASSHPGRILDRLIAAGINVPLSLAPLPILRLVDAGFGAIGFRPRQIALAIQKS